MLFLGFSFCLQVQAEDVSQDTEREIVEEIALILACQDTLKNVDALAHEYD